MNFQEFFTKPPQLEEASDTSSPILTTFQRRIMKHPQETNLPGFKKKTGWLGKLQVFLKNPRFEAPTTGQSEMELVKEDVFFSSGYKEGEKWRCQMPKVMIQNGVRSLLRNPESLVGKFILANLLSNTTLEWIDPPKVGVGAHISFSLFTWDGSNTPGLFFGDLDS